MNREALRVIREEHATLSSMLQSLIQLVRRGPEVDGRDDSIRFFDTLRAMLFYIDEFPEKHHHPKESALVFPLVAKAAPHIAPVIQRLESEHQHGHERARELMHLMVAWELLGEGRRQIFEDEVQRYVDFYREHMRMEEQVILPEAERNLSSTDWHVLNAAFATNRDPLNGQIPRDPQFDRLFTRILMKAPAPIGLGQ